MKKPLQKERDMEKSAHYKKQAMRVVFFLLLASAGLACAPRYCQVRLLPPPLSREEIISRARRGLPDKEIIREIDETGTVLYLRTIDVLRMKKNGVSDQVIDHLITVKEWTLLNSQRRTADHRSRLLDSGASEPRKLMPVSVY